MNMSNAEQAVILCLVCVLAVGLLCPLSYANMQVKLTPQFLHLNRAEGLSQSRVSCIIQDTYGFMWFGTANGLNRYDGYEFTVYRNDPDDPYSISHNDIQTLYRDSNGQIWIGTYGGGLNRYDQALQRFVRYTHAPDAPTSLSHNTVLTLYEDRDGMLWVGTDGGGLNKFDPDSEQFQQYLHDPDNPGSLSADTVWALHEDRAGNLWIGTGNGLDRYDRNSNRFFRYANDPDSPDSLSHNAVLTIYEDSAERLWIGTSNGLNHYDRKTNRFHRYYHDPENPRSLASDEIYALAEDHKGRLWIGTYNGGLNRFVSDREGFGRYMHDPENRRSLSHDIVLAIYEDLSGGLWIGTEEGLNYYDLETKPFAHYYHDRHDPSSLSDNYVSAIYEDHNGTLWIGTDAGLDRRIREDGLEYFRHYGHIADDPNSLSSDEVSAIYQDRHGVLWIGTYGGGLNRFSQTSQEFMAHRHDSDDAHSLSDDYVLTLLEDRDGTLWIGTEEGGLNAYDGETGQFRHYQYDPDDAHSLSSSRVIALYEDRAGTLWVGTDGGGLNRFDRVSGQAVRYENDPQYPERLADFSVWAIYEDQAGRFWLGTEQGLVKFERDTGTFTQYRQKHGLPNDVVFGIIEDDTPPEDGGPFLWLSTETALSKFHPQRATFRNYDTNDGLQLEFNQGAYHKTPDGQLLFGGIEGVTAFFPNEILDNPHLPQIAITDFQLFNKSVPIGQDSLLQSTIMETDRLQLSYKDYVVSFEFVAFHYAAPKKNQYAYIMEGFDKEWIYPGAKRRFVTYTNLPAGEYTFRVRGANNDGVWAGPAASIALQVTPPPWKTWWAYMLYGLAGIGVVLGYVQYKQLQHKRERAILDRFVPYEYLEFLGKKSILDVKLGDNISDEMAVMFSDIRSFTTLSETMTSQENFDFVNAYLKRVAPVIRRNHGFIVKFLGDGMMAIFPNGADDAVRAGIEKLEQVNAYNVHRRQDGWKPIRIGIGIHTGHMMVGMVGEEFRISGDAFSDNVNLTARLEGLTKFYGVSLIASKETMEKLSTPEEYQIRFLDNVQVKGRTQAIAVYDVFNADPEDRFTQKLTAQADFTAGQQHYFAREFDQALGCFQKVLAANPDDATTQLYIRRSEENLQNGVPEEWTGIEKRTTK